MRRSRSAVAVALLAFAGLATLAVRTLRPRALVHARSAVGAPVAAAPTPRHDTTSNAGALPPPPASLRDTTPDGDLATDAAGHFVPTASALALFDYFLSATGEEPLDAIRARIAGEIRRRLADPAAGEAEALLERYLAYREDARRLTAEGQAPADLERRLQWIRELRRKHFGPEVAEALFGDEERATELALARRRVATDASLSPDERERRLEALDADQPEDVREARRLARSMAASKEEVDALRARGASDAEVWSARERRFGPDAADRLAALDAKRTDWQRRYDAYRGERDALVATPEVAALAAEEREARVEALRAERFDETERIRVRALDGMATEATPR